MFECIISLFNYYFVCHYLIIYWLDNIRVLEAGFV